LKDFDSFQQDSIGFLTDKRVRLHFPFFANTFALAYHYANVVAKSGGKWEEARELVLEHDWEYPLPKLIDGEVNVFYATSASMKAFLRSDNAMSWHVEAVPFTKYKPLWIFTDFKSSLGETLGNRDNPAVFSAEIGAMIRNQRIKRLELITDIPGQTPALLNHLVKWGLEREIVVLKQPVDALRWFEPSEKVMRLYFYGAPSTTRMLGEPFKYIGIKFPDNVTWDDDTNITCICMASPRSGDNLQAQETQPNLANSEIAKLRSYHDRVFVAAEQSHTDLLNIWWAYNRYAERKQHSSSFKNPEVFAKCLIEHHAPL
jgi:hypothetical protein